MNLNWPLNTIRKNAPEALTPFITDYCEKSEIAGDTTYNYGYGSIKWAMDFIETLDPDRVTFVLFSIICESGARKMDEEILQHHVYRLFSLRKYKELIRQMDEIDAKKLPFVLIGPLKVVINNSGRSNITSQIFRTVHDAAIVLAASPHHSSAISFHSSIDVTDIKDNLLNALGEIEEGWEFVTRENGPSTFINRKTKIYGHQYLLELIRSIAD
jgi:hypothetical protein